MRKHHCFELLYLQARLAISGSGVALHSSRCDPVHLGTARAAKMLQKKSFVKKTRGGKVMKVRQQHQHAQHSHKATAAAQQQQQLQQTPQLSSSRQGS